LAVARDLLADASNLTEIAEECGWNQELPDHEAALAGWVEARPIQLQSSPPRYGRPRGWVLGALIGGAGRPSLLSRRGPR
jgi:hypothetical protein